MIYQNKEGTQIVGTLFAVYGWIIPAIGWGKALAIWGYAIVWLLLLIVIKVLSYSVMRKNQLGKQRAEKKLVKKTKNNSQQK